MKYKVLIALSILLVIGLVAYGAIGFINLRREYISTHPTVKTDVILNYKEVKLNSPVPVFSDFVSDKSLSGEIKIYKDNQLIDSTVLYELGEYKVEININGKNYVSILIVTE